MWITSSTIIDLRSNSERSRTTKTASKLRRAIRYSQAPGIWSRLPPLEKIARITQDTTCIKSSSLHMNRLIMRAFGGFHNTFGEGPVGVHTFRGFHLAFVHCWVGVHYAACSSAVVSNTICIRGYCLRHSTG